MSIYPPSLRKVFQNLVWSFQAQEIVFIFFHLVLKLNTLIANSGLGLVCLFGLFVCLFFCFLWHGIEIITNILFSP